MMGIALSQYKAVPLYPKIQRFSSVTGEDRKPVGELGTGMAHPGYPENGH